MSEKDKKPGKSGAARPPVINVKAKTVKPAADKTTSAGKPAGAAATGAKGSTSARPSSAAPSSAPSTEKQKAGATTAQEQPSAASHKAPRNKDSKPPADKPEEKKPEQEKKGKDAKKDAAAATGASKTDAGGASKSEQPKKADGDTQQAAEKPKKSRTGLKVLLGLLLLGGAAGGGAWIYHQYGPGQKLAALEQRLKAAESKLAAAGQAQQLAAELTALKQKVAGLEAAQQDLAGQLKALASGGSGDLAGKVQALENKIGALTALPEQLENTTTRLATLEKAVENLRGQMNALREGLEQISKAPAAATGQTGDANATGAAAPAAGASAAALVALKLALKETQQKLAALNEQVATLRAGADPARFKMLEARLKKLEEGLIRVRSDLGDTIAKVQEQALQATRRAEESLAAVEELKRNPPVPEYVPPPQAVAFAALRRKVMAGEPFAAELEKLASIMPGASELDVLSPHAKKGVPTVEALAGRLKALASGLTAGKAAPTPAERDGSDPLATLKNKLFNVVKVRKAGEVNWPALIAQARRKLASEGLSAAITLLAPHEEKAPAALREWLNDARARLKVERALSMLAQEILSQGARGEKVQ